MREDRLLRFQRAVLNIYSNLYYVHGEEQKYWKLKKKLDEIFSECEKLIEEKDGD